MKQRNKESTSRNWQVKSLGVATLLTFILSLSTVSAQESLNVAGGDASGSGGSVSYSIGQVAYQTHTTTNGSLAEGLQQPFEISVVTAIEEVKGINLTVTAYPNPTSHYLILSIDEFELSDLSYQLYDMNGKLLQSEKITDNRTSIVMSNLVPATYFVKVMLGNKEIKTFKIIKTQ